MLPLLFGGLDRKHSLERVHEGVKALLFKQGDHELSELAVFLKPGKVFRGVKRIDHLRLGLEVGFDRWRYKPGLDILLQAPDRQPAFLIGDIAVKAGLLLPHLHVVEPVHVRDKQLRDA